MENTDTFRERARAWLAANRHLAPPNYGAIVPPELVDEGTAWQRRLLEAGMTGLHWPTDVGGQGLSRDHTAAWLEEAARADVPPFLDMVSLVLMGETVLARGTREQQAEHLPPTLRGERVWCQLFSEPGAGSDLASLSTRAERDGDVFVVNGQEVCGVAMGTLTNERGHIGASVITLGRRVAGLSDVDLSTRGRALQALGQRQGPQATTAASLLELGISELFFDIAMARADAAGPASMLAGETADALVGAPGGRIAGGSSQVQRNIVGEILLGLPKEPRPG